MPSKRQKKSNSEATNKSSEDQSHSSHSDEGTDFDRDFELIDAAPVLGIGVGESSRPSERFRTLFPKGFAPYTWPFALSKDQVAPPPFDRVSTDLGARASGNSKLHQAWSKEWEVLQPTIVTEIVAAQGVHEIATFIAEHPREIGQSNLVDRLEQLTGLIEGLLEHHLKRATVIVAGTVDVSLASKVDKQFEAETLGIHPQAVATFRDFKPQYTAQRQSPARGSDQAPSKPFGRGRGRGFKPKAASSSGTSAAAADKGTSSQ